MNPWPQTRAEREHALVRLDADLRDDPLSIDLALDRARLLGELDRPGDARDAYLRVVARSPDHPRALIDFGTFLVQGGFRAAARTVYERAVAVDPRSATAQANLANVYFADTDYEAARRHYESALAIDPRNVHAHQGLSYALTRLGREDEALRHRRLGFAGRALTTGVYRGSDEPVDVLLLVCAGGGTLYTDTFLDDRIFRTSTLVADLYTGTPLLPQIDVVFNAIGDADRAAAALTAMDQLLAAVAAPVINAPDRVLATTRESNAARLAALEGVIAPRTRRVSRADLDAAAYSYPLLVRAPGFHTGEHFARVERAADFGAAVAAFPGDDVLVIDYVDVRGDDGSVRKYRMMAIDGVLYPLHVAISQQWKVHYFSADMAENAANRAEDERFLNDPAAVLGAPAMAALARVAAAVGLEYLGIDFALDRAGRVVVFEANATMIVLPPGPDPRWDYRRAPSARAIDAVRTMLLGRQ
jgi:hypothetical protein